MIFSTNRLMGREFIRQDAYAIFQLNSNQKVLKYTGDVAFKNIDEAYSFIQNYSHYSDFGYGRWAVVEKATQQTIGWCGLKYHPEEQYTDLGFRFLEEKWNLGFATEAAMACIDYGFKELALERLVCRVQQQNGASIRVIEKLGFKRVGALDFDGIPGWLYELMR